MAQISVECEARWYVPIAKDENTVSDSGPSWLNDNFGKVVFDWKTDRKGSIVRQKARLLAKVVLQVAGIDYFDVIPLFSTYTLVYLMLSLVVKFCALNVAVHVEVTFVSSRLEEELYVVQPEVVKINKYGIHLISLTKAEYGL